MSKCKNHSVTDEKEIPRDMKSYSSMIDLIITGKIGSTEALTSIQRTWQSVPQSLHQTSHSNLGMEINMIESQALNWSLIEYRWISF